MKNCVVRTYGRSYNYSYPMDDLTKKLKEDWIVKFITPIINPNNGKDYIEYILEKDE